MDFVIEIVIVLIVVATLYLLNKYLHYKEFFLKIMVTNSAYQMMVIFFYFLFRIIGWVTELPLLSSSTFRSITLGAALYLLQIPKKGEVLK